MTKVARILLPAVLPLVMICSAAAQSPAGLWRYKSPAADVEGIALSKFGRTMLNMMISSSVKKEIGHELDSVGIDKKSFSLDLARNGLFDMHTANGFVKGTYGYDAKGSMLTLSVAESLSAAGRAAIDGSKMTLLFSMEQFSEFMIILSLAEYRGNITESVMTEVRAMQEESAAELREMDESLKKFREEMQKGVDEKKAKNEISEEDARKAVEMFANMNIVVGIELSR